MIFNKFSNYDLNDLFIKCDRNAKETAKLLASLSKTRNIEKCLKHIDKFFLKGVKVYDVLSFHQGHQANTVEYLYKQTGYDKSRIEFLVSIASYSYSYNYSEANKRYNVVQNKNQDVVSCPKCGSQSITATNKKLSVKRGAVGAVIGSAVNPVGTAVGAVAGGLSSKKMYNVCMNCGHRWKP